jgi:Sulfotransferase family
MPVSRASILTVLFRSLRLKQTSLESPSAPMPIIVGSPRSGTTLLRLMLDSHPELTIPPETGFLALAPKLRGSGDKLRERFFRAIINHPKPTPAWPDFEIPESAFWAALTEIAPFTLPEGFRAFYRLYAARSGKSRWGDKTPLYCLELDTIRRVLPEACFIHIIRDGRDAALSLRRMRFSPGWKIETQAAYWRKNILSARRAGRGRPDYMEVRYEDLILNTRVALERICAFVSLSYNDAMLSYYTRAPERLREHKGRSRLDGTPLLTQEQRLCQQKRTTEPPDTTCVFAWKRSMSAEERGRFQLVAGDLLQDLGYEV